MKSTNTEKKSELDIEIKQMEETLSLLDIDIQKTSETLEMLRGSKAYYVWRSIIKVKKKLFWFFHLRNYKRFIADKAKSYRLSKSESAYITTIDPVTVKKDYKISIIIPTYNAESFLPALLTALFAQSNLEDLDVIIIDSESKDKTVSIAKKFGVTVLTIKQKDFSHSTARNIAAKSAKHDLLLFTVQDALPIEPTTFAKMAEMILKDTDIAAVSTIQVARPDADLFARMQVSGHKELLQLDTDFISSVQNMSSYYKETFMLKRKVALLDDVCALYKKEIFNELNSFTEIGFGEDLDFALKALKSGYKIGTLSTSGVIHSHNRSADYFLKRTYVSSMIDLDLLISVDKTLEIKPDLNLYIGLLLAEYLHANDFSLFQSDHENLVDYCNAILTNQKQLNPKTKVGQMIEEVFSDLEMPKPNIEVEHVVSFYKTLQLILTNYLNSNPTVIATDQETKDFMTKMIASNMGSSLAQYCLGKQSRKIKKHRIILDNLLSGNV